MKHIGFLSLVLVLPSVCMAKEISLPLSKDIEISSLAGEIKAVVPELEGLSEDRENGTLEARPLSGDFSDEQKRKIEKALKDHDAQKAREDKENDPVEIPVEDFAGGAAGALAVLGGRGLVIRAQKKTEKKETG